MNFTGLIIGCLTFCIIGFFHPIVIWAEYHFSKRVWPVFLLAGIVFAILSLLADSVIASCLLAVIAASCLWSILELFEQEKRVAKGWFPKKEKKPAGNEGEIK